ncbi:uncharacterized protein LOC143208074 [Lasioglossum baleicum]|uniref:uncharacterized protein LOC143208074 n=1 Tax=Lasioglossum baleicum TaxID=434251 RepID=UPI003FCC729A
MQNQLFSSGGLDQNIEENMWTKLVALFLLFAIVAYDPVIARTCKDGQSYDNGCNECHCTNGHVACTRMSCEGVTILPPPESFWE